MPAPLNSVVRVSPGETNPTHHISLFDGTETHGLILKDGARSVQEIPQTASTLRFTGGNGKFGDYEPALSHLEQRTWQGGRAGEDFSDDPSKFFDSHHAWTLTPNRIMPGPEPVPAYGLRSQDLLSRKNANSTGWWDFYWRPLHGATRGIANRFLASASYSADKVYIYVRRVGTPGTLTVELRSDTATTPGAVLKSQTATTTTVPDYEGVWLQFDWTTTQALTSGTAYWIDIFGASTDNVNNHWVVGTGSSGTYLTGMYYAVSADGSTWTGVSTTGYYIFRNIVDADTKREFKYFILDGLLYAVSINSDTAVASKLYMNGTRGKITSAGANFVDTNNSDPVTLGSYYYILRGTGAGQSGVISAGSTPAGGLTIAAHDADFGTDSEYIIYNTDLWKEITGTGLGVVKDVVVAGNIAYFAQGTTTIRKIRFNYGAAPPAHEFGNDATDDADHITIAYVDNKPVVWIGINSTSAVQKADAVAWGSTMTFATAIPVGDSTWPISKLLEYDDGLAVMKPDGVFLETAANTFERLPVDIDRLPEITNGKAALAKDLFLYFNFSASVEKYYSGTLSDVGPWRGPGLPYDRAGHISYLEGGIGLVFAAIDGGTSKYSSVLATDGIGWHEVFRAPRVGHRIRSIKWHGQPGYAPRLWVECNGDMWSLVFPNKTLNPANDSGFMPAHECSVVSSTFDMGSANLPKYFKELTLVSRNIIDDLPFTGQIYVDYQVDDDITSNTAGSGWTPLDRILSSPEYTIPVDIGNAKAIRFRYRIYATYASQGIALTPNILGTVLEGYSRTPIKYQYIFRASVGDDKSTLDGKPDIAADDLVDWLKKISVSARKVTMRSVLKQLDEKLVVVEPPTIMRDGVTEVLPGLGRRGWTGEVSVIVREV